MEYHIIIKNGKIIDGAGNPWYRGDIAIKEGKIVKIKHKIEGSASKEINADQLIVCPGFIDMHSHSDFAIIFDNKLQSTIRQGITTSVIGNCGGSMAPITADKMRIYERMLAPFIPPGATPEITWFTFHEYLNEMEKLGSSSNLACLVGMANVRVAAGPGLENRSPTNEEYKGMKEHIKEAMEAGAFGMSTGLIYPPQTFATTEEIIELAKVVGEYNGLYFSHIRGEGETVLNAVKEVIEIVEKSGCIGGQIAHHKIAGKANWGKSVETLKLVSDANERSINVTFDQYPYNRGMTALINVLPPWVAVGGVKKFMKRARDPKFIERIKSDAQKGYDMGQNFIKEGGFETIFIASVKNEKWKNIEGKNIAEITKIKGKEDDWQTFFEILIDDNGETLMTIEMMGEEDIRRIMKGRYTMIGTDGWGVAPTGILSFGMAHPRHYGTFPRILGKYVREENLMTLEEAIRKMTSFPAQRLGLTDRGLVREGVWADLVIFNPNTVIDKATFEQPHQFSEGIKYVIVNGIVVVENEQQNESLPGKILKRPL